MLQRWNAYSDALRPPRRPTQSVSICVTTLLRGPTPERGNERGGLNSYRIFTFSYSFSRSNFGSDLRFGQMAQVT